MKIIKRSGAEAIFDANKIAQAVKKANDSVVEAERLSHHQIAHIVEKVEKQCLAVNRSLNVEEIQDLVENAIMREQAFSVARNYVRYRYERELARTHNTTDERIKSILECNNEEVLTDIHTADPEWNVILLRYFNPIGAHKSGLIGEDPKGIPNNLLPYVAQVAIGKLQCINVFGDDYDTPDGTGVRDYIHVVDLARGHVKAIQKLADKDGVNIYNLGTGKGYSVLDVIHAFEKACGKKLPYVIKPRRAGDIATCYSKCDKAAAELGWTAQYDIDEMCADSWNWQTKNPNGYND